MMFLFLSLILLLQSTVFQENQDLLVKCISQDLGFFGGRPIAACVIYKCLLHWRSFEVERTGIFDRVIQTIASAIEVSHSWWFSDIPVFLSKLSHTLLVHII